MEKKYMKFILLLIVVIVAVLFAYSYLNFKYNKNSIASIQLDIKSFGLKVNESRQLEYMTIPDEGIGTLKFISSNEDIIEVNSITGYVTARKVGSATITVLDENNSILQQCIVYGLKNKVELQEIVAEDEIKIANGKSYMIAIELIPSNATIPSLKYTSSDESVVKIIGNGKISAVGVGSAYVQITSDDSKIDERVLVIVNQSEEYTQKENIDYTIDVEEIRIKKEKLEVKVNEVYQIDAEVIPSNATNKDLSYEIIDESIAEILENGVIKGKKEGKTIIEIRSVNNIIKKIEVEVKKNNITPGNIDNSNKEIIATGINLEVTNLNMVEGEERKLVAEVTPSNATNKNLTWTSSNKKVAIVDNGKIKAIGIGNCTVIVKTNNGIMKKIEISVAKNKIEVEDVATNVESVKIGIDETVSVITIVSPLNATDKNLIWTSSNSSVATVTNEGLIKGINVGKCIVTVKSSNGIEKKINVEISKVEATKLELSKEETTIKVGNKEIINYNISPNNVTDKKVTFTSNNTSVAIVSSSGEITGKNAGYVIITAKIGNITKNIKVTVLNKEVRVNKVDISGSSSVSIGDEIALKAVVTPSNATNQMISWKSSNSSVATVDSNGIVKGIKAGDVSITATVDGKSNSYKVKVVEVAVSSITSNTTKIELNPNKSQVISVMINPLNATNKNLTWTSSNPSVAKVGSSGIVTALKEGNAVISAKSNNGKTVNISVSVVDNSSIDITNFSIVSENTFDENLNAYIDKLQKAIKEKTNVNLSITKDKTSSVEKTPSTTKEIIIGKTNRLDSQELLNRLKAKNYKDGYGIQIIDNKIIILGTSYNSTIKAIEVFIENYVKKSNGSKLNVSYGKDIIKEYIYEQVIYASNGTKFEVENTSVIFNSPQETWGTGVGYPSIIELQYSGNNNGKLLATFDLYNSGKTGKPTSFHIMESKDRGYTWTEISQVYEKIDASIEASWNPHLFELPEQLGELKKGTILLAGCSIDSAQTRKSQLSIWKSDDAGKTWKQYSVIAEGAGIGKGVWEPYLFYDNGYLYCFYSDDSGNKHDQKIVYKRTKDGKNWEEMVDAVAPNNYSYRPGMPVVTKMGNGKYFMVYEMFGNWDGCPIYYKVSDNITSWNYSSLGKKIVGTNGYTMGSAPWCIWIPSGGEKGTLIVTAKYGSSKTNKIFVSFDYGETFQVIDNPLPHSNVDGMGYSASLFVSNNKTTLLYANTVDYQNGKAKIVFSKINIYG